MSETFKAMVNGENRRLKKGTLEQIFGTLYKHDKKAMAAIVDGALLELTQTVEKANKIEFLFPGENEEASRIFLRGLLFLLLRAIKHSMGEANLYAEYVLNGGIYCTLDVGTPVTSVQIKVLEEKMKDYVLEGMPFVNENISTDDAISYFKMQNEMDKVRLLSFRPFDFFQMYHYNGCKNYFYGIMPPDATYLDGFSLKKFDKGFIMTFPAPYWVGEQSYKDQPKLKKVFQDAEKFAKILEASKVADLNDLVRSTGLKEFIMVNEALHEKKLSELANNICEREDARIILIAGPSSSGKTTFANRLKIHLRVHGKKCHPISIDDYYLDKDKIPVDEEGKKDLENITAINTKRFNADIISLLKGKETVLSKFDFKEGKSTNAKKLMIGSEDLLIIEGIHGLNEKLSGEIDDKYKYKVFISPLSPLNLDNQNTVFPEDIRLLRRLIRDKLTRGYGFLDTLNIWESVREGEYKYILPYMENADTIFNSSLLYEAAILKKYAYEELNALKSEHIRANYLLKFLNYFISSQDDNEIPKNSILREFIGDSCFI